MLLLVRLCSGGGGGGDAVAIGVEVEEARKGSVSDLAGLAISRSSDTTDGGGERSNEDEVEVAVDEDECESEPGEEGSGGDGVGEPRPIAGVLVRVRRSTVLLYASATGHACPERAGLAIEVFLPVPLRVAAQGSRGEGRSGRGRVEGAEGRRVRSFAVGPLRLDRLKVRRLSLSDFPDLFDSLLGCISRPA